MKSQLEFGYLSARGVMYQRMMTDVIPIPVAKVVTSHPSWAL